MEEKPRVTVGLIIRKDGKVLLGKRKKLPLGWGFPGGKLDFGEEPIDCVLRELKEEVGLLIKNLRFVTATSDLFPEMNKHFITLLFVADYNSGTVEVKEPDKCEKWEWFKWEKLPSELSSPALNLLKQNFNPFEY